MLKDFCNQTGLKRDRYREQVFSTPTENGLKNWGKSTSQKAVWANKKLDFAKNNDIIKETSKEKVKYRNLTIDEFKSIKHSITKDERKIIYGKTHFSGYINSCNARKINSALRNGEKLNPEFQKIVDTLQSVIEKNSINDNIIVTRYVDKDALSSIVGVELPKATLKTSRKDFFEQLEQYPSLIAKGIEYTEKGFLSTSGVVDANVMKDRDVKFNIKVPSGKNAYISTNNKESEIIFGQNTTLIIENCYIENIGKPGWKVVFDCIMK